MLVTPFIACVGLDECGKAPWCTRIIRACILGFGHGDAGILVEACYTEPTMIRRMKKYWTVLGAGLVVLRVRFLLRMKSLPVVLDRLSPRSMTGEPDQAVMEDVV